jgi:hypothetical protein
MREVGSGHARRLAAFCRISHVTEYVHDVREVF